MPASSLARYSLSSLVVGLFTAGLCNVAMAQDEDTSGPYVGGAFGQFDVELDSIDGVTNAVRNLDADDAAYKLFFGWRFNPYISLEAAYIDLGSPRGDFSASGTDGDYKVELAGLGAYAIGSLPLGIFELSAKVGYYFHDIEIDVDFNNIGPGNGNVFGTDESSEAFTYGVGAGVTLFQRLNAKLEYEVMDIDKLDDATTVWMTGAWRF